MPDTYTLQLSTNESQYNLELNQIQQDFVLNLVEAQDGTDGNTPLLSAVDALQEIQVSYDNGASWETLLEYSDLPSGSDVSALSSNWQSAYNTVKDLSANWNTAFDTVESNSAEWTYAYQSIENNESFWSTNSQKVLDDSPNWDSAYNNVRDLSASWNYNNYLNLTGGSVSGQISSRNASFGLSQKLTVDDDFVLIAGPSGFIISCEDYTLGDNNGTASVDWSNRNLVNSAGSIVFDWSANNRLTAFRDISSNGNLSARSIYASNNITCTGTAAFDGAGSFAAATGGTSVFYGSVLVANSANLAVTGKIGVGTQIPNKELTVIGSISATKTLDMPLTTSTGGYITQDGERFIHNYGGTGSFFAGYGSGNFSSAAVDNTAVGGLALRSNAAGSYNVALGVQALQNCTGGLNMGIGRLTFASTAGSENVGVGGVVFYQHTSGDRNVGIGYGAGFYNLTGQNNTFIGNRAGVLNLGSDNILIGYNVEATTQTSNNELNIGNALRGNLTTGSLSARSDIEITDFTKGIVMLDPLGQRWRLTMTSTGALSSTLL
jgi:hypothetical protein